MSLIHTPENLVRKLQNLLTKLHNEKMIILNENSQSLPQTRETRQKSRVYKYNLTIDFKDNLFQCQYIVDNYSPESISRGDWKCVCNMGCNCVEDGLYADNDLKFNTTTEQCRRHFGELPYEYYFDCPTENEESNIISPWFSPATSPR